MSPSKRRDRSLRADQNGGKKKTGKARKPTHRQIALVKGMAQGKSVREAAMAAGYSEQSANHAGKLLSTEAMRSFMQERFSLDKICLRIDEGMDAELTQTLILGRKGKEKLHVTSMPHYAERRQAAALAARLIGADPTVKFEVKGDFTQLVNVRFMDVAACAEP